MQRLFVAILTIVLPTVAAAGRPNVLFIAVDDLNDWIGCLGGHPQTKTPNLDRLAERGVLFTRAYCAAPACNPSRTALLTGLRPSTTGVYHNSQPWRPVLRDAVTLPQHFKAHGYRVVGTGKIFHGAFNDPASWDEYRRRPSDPNPTAQVRNDPHSKAGGIVWGPLDVEDSATGDYQLVEFAAEFLQQKHDRPFFFACGFVKPHMPWQVPRKYYDLFPVERVVLPKILETDLSDVPLAGRRMARPEGDHLTIIETANWNQAVQAYLATIHYVDGQIGRLLAALDQSPYRDNTIIVLWGDHGWHLGEKQHWRKFALWEEATRAPLVVAGPNVKRGQCQRTVDFVDIYPTLCALCDLPIGKQLEGRSLVPLLRDPSAAWDRPALTTHGRGNHAVRAERYRYIRYADGSEELYDHDADPLEWTNLADRPESAKIKSELAAWLPKTNAPDAPHVKERGKKQAKRKRKNATAGEG
jgi:arylsulfatase A-like enzyme